MTDLSTYVDLYRAALDRNDVEAMDELFDDVPDGLLVQFHRAVQEFDPVTAPVMDARVVSDRLVASGRTDRARADFIGAVASGDLPSFIAQAVPAGAETDVSERLVEALGVTSDRAAAVEQVATYVAELAGRGEPSILDDAPEVSRRRAQLERAWSLVDRALDALGDVLDMPGQVIRHMRDATEYPSLGLAGGLARADGAILDAAVPPDGLDGRSEVGRMFDDLQPPPQ